MIKAVILLGIIGMTASSILPQILPVYPKYPVVPVVKVPLVKYPVVPVAKYPAVPVAKVPVVPSHLPVVPVAKVPAVLPLTKIGYETIPQQYVRDYRVDGYKNLGYAKYPEYFDGYKNLGYVKYPEYLGYKGFAYEAPYYGYGDELRR